MVILWYTSVGDTVERADKYTKYTQLSSAHLDQAKTLLCFLLRLLTIPPALGGNLPCLRIILSMVQARNRLMIAKIAKQLPSLEQVMMTQYSSLTQP